MQNKLISLRLLNFTLNYFMCKRNKNSSMLLNLNFLLKLRIFMGNVQSLKTLNHVEFCVNKDDVSIKKKLFRCLRMNIKCDLPWNGTCKNYEKTSTLKLGFSYTTCIQDASRM